MPARDGPRVAGNAHFTPWTRDSRRFYRELRQDGTPHRGVDLRRAHPEFGRDARVRPDAVLSERELEEDEYVLRLELGRLREHKPTNLRYSRIANRESRKYSLADAPQRTGVDLYLRPAHRGRHSKGISRS